MRELSIAAHSVVTVRGPEWGSAFVAAERVQQALDALEALNIGTAQELLREALSALPMDLDEYYDWPYMVELARRAK